MSESHAHGRDFGGYRGAPPPVRWPGDAQLAQSIVVKVEEGAELSISMGDEANDFNDEPVERVDRVRDLCMESHFEYGTSAGWRWERHGEMDEAPERRVIQQAVTAIETASGSKPAGWHTRSATSVNTRRQLVEHGGFAYDSNASNDECPFAVVVSGHAYLVLPCAFNTNDTRFTDHGGFHFADDFSRYCIDAFEVFYRAARLPIYIERF